MRISTKGVYALEAVVDLAMNLDQGLVTIKDIAGRRNLSEKYLERIVGELKKGRIVKSTRGKYGGYSLARPMGEITVKEVLLSVEGDLAPVVCLKGSTDCGINCDQCATRVFWNGLWEEIKQVIDGITIEQLVFASVEEE